MRLIDTFYDRQIGRGAARMLPGRADPVAELAAEAA